MMTRDPIELLWMRRQVEKHDRAELRKLCAEVSEKQRELAPMIAAADARRKAAMRQDGPTGFVMVRPS